MTAGSQEWACLPSPCILQVFCLAESSKDALAWRLACKSFHAVCGKVDMLKLRVLGDAKAAVSELDSSAGDFSTWFGLDLDFAPMELVQQVGGRRSSPRTRRRWTGQETCRHPPRGLSSSSSARHAPSLSSTLQGRLTSPFVLRPEQAKLVERVMKARPLFALRCSSPAFPDDSPSSSSLGGSLLLPHTAIY